MAEIKNINILYLQEEDFKEDVIDLIKSHKGLATPIHVKQLNESDLYIPFPNKGKKLWQRNWSICPIVILTLDGTEYIIRNTIT